MYVPRLYFVLTSSKMDSTLLEMHKGGTASAHLVYPQWEAVFFPLHQCYRGVSIYWAADEPWQTDGHVDD